eukprot:GEMP01010078.1.p1 GENE.GEMP01010078.1~~GEMP01010078.1.p1  ORF type:complete len:819 (+),score=154.13 GEMP01010078.1:24-2459(+)
MDGPGQHRFGDQMVSIFEPTKKFDVPDIPDAARLERALSWRRRVLSLTADEAVFCTSSVVVLHHLTTGEQRFFYGHNDEVTAICTAFRHAASGDMTGVALVWALDTLSIKKRLEFHKNPVLAMQFLPNTRPFLITCALNNNGEHPLALWQVGGGKQEEPIHTPMRVTNGGKNEVVGIYAKKKDAEFVSYGAHHLKVWYPCLLAPHEPIKFQRAAFGHGYALGRVTCVTEVSLGLVCGTDTGDVFVLDASTDNNLIGRRICGSVTSPKTNVVMVLDAPDAKEAPIALFKDGTKVQCVDKSHARSSIWTNANETLRPILIAAVNNDNIAVCSASHLMIGDTRTLNFHSLLIQPPSLKMECLAVLDSRIAVGTPEGLFIMRNNVIDLELPGHATACLLVDTFLAVAMDKWLRVIDLKSGKTCGDKQLQSRVCSLAAFEGLYAAGMENGGINFFDGPELKQGSLSKCVTCHKGPVTSMAFAGQFLYSCSMGNVVIFDAVLGRRLSPGDEMLSVAKEMIPTPFSLPYSFATRGAWSRDKYAPGRQFSASGNVLCASNHNDVELFPFPAGNKDVTPVILRRVHTSPVVQMVCRSDAMWTMSNNSLMSWRFPRKALQERMVQDYPKPVQLSDESTLVIDKNDPELEKSRRQQKLIDSRLPQRVVETVEDPNAVGRREKLEEQWAKKGRVSPKVGTPMPGVRDKKEKTPVITPVEQFAGVGSNNTPSFRSTGMFRHRTQLTEKAFEIEIRCLRSLSKVTKNAFRREITFFSYDIDFIVKVPWGYDVENLEVDKKFEGGLCFVTIPKALWTADQSRDDEL